VRTHGTNSCYKSGCRCDLCKSWCREYGRLRAKRNGKPGLSQIRRPFWDNVGITDDTADCWPWLLGRSGKGYGNTVRQMHGARVAGAHRIAWVIVNGPIPAGLFVCHACDNPPCCNPSHLWLGTNSDNLRDAVAKGRRKVPTRWEVVA
jgi:hypothetical protein